MIANNRCRGKCSGAGPCTTLCHLARRPLRSRPRKCAISISTDASVGGALLRRFSGIGSGRLLHAPGGPGRSVAVLNSIDPTLVRGFRNEIETKLLTHHTGEKAP